jgi:hypothetical protein
MITRVTPAKFDWNGSTSFFNAFSGYDVTPTVIVSVKMSSAARGGRKLKLLPVAVREQVGREAAPIGMLDSWLTHDAVPVVQDVVI